MTTFVRTDAPKAVKIWCPTLNEVEPTQGPEGQKCFTGLKGEVPKNWFYEAPEVAVELYALEVFQGTTIVDSASLEIHVIDEIERHHTFVTEVRVEATVRVREIGR